MNPRHSTTLPERTSLSASSPQQSRFSLRSSLSSVFKGSSVYSQSSRSAAASPPQRPESRFRLSQSLRGTRFTSSRPPRATRSRSSTRSLIDASAMPVGNVRPLSLPRESQNRSRGDSPHVVTSQSTSGRVLSGASPQGLVLQQDARRGLRQQDLRHKRRKSIFSREAFRHSKVRVKATMSLAFGFTLLAALAVYLGLAVAGIGSGAMYHTLFILLILALTAVFCHSLLRMFMCMVHPSERAISSRRVGRGRRREWDNISADGVMPEKPIRIIMASDEDEEAQLSVVGQHLPVAAVEKVVVRPPPPVYGEYRGSKNEPESCALAEAGTTSPSPLTPTYEEAMREVQRVVGYRPPSYASDAGEVINVQMRLEDVHPLERERMRDLIGVAI